MCPKCKSNQIADVEDGAKECIKCGTIYKESIKEIVIIKESDIEVLNG